MIPVVISVAVVIFTIMYFAPGDPATALLGSSATKAEIEELREMLGLDKPYIVRLGYFLRDTFLRFDLGKSYIHKVPVAQELFKRLPRTVLIAVICISIQALVGTPLGIMAAINHNKLSDRIAMFIALAGVSVPSFWLALMLIVVFSVKLGWLPPYGIGSFKHYILPCIANSFVGITTQARQTRSSMLEVIRSDYIVTARAKGLSERDVLYKHALPNALIPLITILGNGFNVMLGGTLIIETVFSIPGVGTYIMSAISNRDYPVIQGSIIVLAIFTSLIMLVVDILYAFVDPRIKAQFEGRVRR
jgi:peptide/nickel transport system permease protein